MTPSVALVTGASSGIGAEFARQLGARGADLVLVARRADRLEALGADIAATSGVRCHVVAADLSRPEAAHDVWAKTQALGLEVDWLVNNAGFGTDGFFPDLPLDRELAQVHVHVTTLMTLCRLYLPGMVARRRGTVINLGSVGSFVPTPYMATYCATKAFVLSFSEGLAGEVAGSGVTVLALCPGAVRTEFHEVAGVTGRIPEFGFMTAEGVVARAIAAAGRRRRLLVPGWMNTALVASIRFTPRRLASWLAGSMFHPGRG